MDVPPDVLDYVRHTAQFLDLPLDDAQVGRVALGSPERPLTQVARLSISLMVVLAVVTVLAVAIAM